MSTVLAIVGAILGLGGIVGGAVYFIKQAMGNSVALDEQGAALQLEQQHTAAMQAAADAARAERAKEFDAAKASVHTASDAAGLLAGQYPGHT